MKKKRILKRIIIILCSIIFILGATSLGLFLQGTCFNSRNDTIMHEENAKWMSYIDDDAKLTEIAIPGSHDSGTCGMIYLGSTQCFKVKDQLERGVRYLDLRVRKEKDDYYLYHSILNGEKFIPALEGIVDFITTHKEETLLLDFQHFDKDSKEDVFNLVKTKLVDKNLALINDSGLDDLSFIDSVKLSSTRGKCVIFFGTAGTYANNNFIFARNNNASSYKGVSLNSTYVASYNKMSSKDYIEKGIPAYIEQIKEKINEEGKKGIFVLQGQLTDGMYILGPYSRERSHNENMNKYINSLKTSSDLSLINVIMRDFVNETKCEQIISLNSQKNLIKTTSIDEFKVVYNY